MHYRSLAPALLAPALLAVVPLVCAQGFDTRHSRFAFKLKTRWGQTLNGRFPRYEGEVTRLPDGRQQVRIALFADAVEIEGNRRYTEFSRSGHFFDARRHPRVNFVSDPYSPELLRDGGRLTGMLRLRGVSRRESFAIAPSDCARPAVDCDLVATGSVRREDYAMDGWQMAVRNRVRFALNVRLAGAAP